jgi:hypothetical protein
MPFRPDALVEFRDDAVKIMEAAAADLEVLGAQWRATLARQQRVLEQLGATGAALAEAAYHDGDGGSMPGDYDLLNPEAEDVVALMENGMELPDLTDLSRQVGQVLEEALKRLRDAIRQAREVPVPEDGMVLVMTDERREAEAEREAERLRGARARPRSRSRS